MDILKKFKALFGAYDASEYTTERSVRAIFGDRSRQGSEDSLVPQYQRDILIHQCQDVYRNNPIARGIVKRMCDMVVGQGITPMPSTHDAEWNKQCSEVWKSWCKSPEPTEMLSLVDVLNLTIAATLVEGGSAILLHRKGTIEVIELERFRTPPDGSSKYPYKRDAHGRITHWCLHDRNEQGKFDNAKNHWSWVGAQNILTMFPRDRADQILPIPQLACCLNEIRDVQELNRFTLRQAKIQSLPSLVHTRGSDGAKANFGNMRGHVDKQAEDERNLRNFAEAHGMSILDTSGSMSALAPATPSSTYESFIKLNLKLIAMAVGIPLDVMMLWFSDGTYSSNKATLTQAREAIAKRQQLLLRTILEPLYKWRIRKAIENGELPEAPIGESGFPEIRCEWQMPSYEWMDASDSLQSSLLSIRAGLSSISEECEKRGHNLEDLMRTKIQDALTIRKMAEEHGLSTVELSDIVIPGASPSQTQGGK